MRDNGPVQHPSRPAFLDALVVVLILALVAGVVVLQTVLHGGGDERPAAGPTARESGGVVSHSSLGPSPTPTPPPGTAVPTPTASAGPTPGPGAQASELARSAQSMAAAPALFRIATFNVLGASHTRRGGDSRIKTSYADRLPRVLQVLARHQADVVGFQEFEPPQAALFRRLGGPAWAMFPSPGSPVADGRQTIAWRADRFDLAATRTVAYPYFGGRPVRTPAVRLRLRSTQDTFWVINVHNPATACAVCGGNNDRWRDEAVRREIAAVRQLGADGTPVFLVGDMNAKDAFFCTMAAALPVAFANGGAHDGTGPAGCRPPRPTPIDWIVATGGVSFSGYLSDDSALVDAASDHPAYSVTAMLP